jgi:hypothetical protein
MAANCRRFPCVYFSVSCLEDCWVANQSRDGHALEDSVVERGKVVLGDDDQGPLVETPLHCVIEFLTKDA